MSRDVEKDLNTLERLRRLSKNKDVKVKSSKSLVPYRSKEEFLKAQDQEDINPIREDLTVLHLFDREEELMGEVIELRRILLRITKDPDCHHPEAEKAV